MYEIHIEDSFAAGHFLRRYQGKCENLHGHNYKVNVSFQADSLDKADLAIDFTVAKKWLKQILDVLDHKCLNDLPMFTEDNPSAEKIAKYIYTEYQKLLPASVKMTKVKIWETDRNAVSYWE
ncbi:MAG: 6-carboxytetrahydropterin synthase QueD [Pseudohongiella sp.]|nr:6-carboxytetrahydropterin synthase QueD [Pseudohongiella sp.]